MSRHDYPSMKPNWLPDDTRVAKRALIQLPVFLMALGGEPFSATFTNIATHGFRVWSGYPAKMGQFLSIEIPAFARYSGWVAWTHTTEFGFDVANPLPELVIDHIINLALQD